MRQLKDGEKRRLSLLKKNVELALMRNFRKAFIAAVFFFCCYFSFSQTAEAYEYRGMHLDVSRHFFGKDVVKKYIDTLAKYNITYFHWHLTDDQGWRIEIKKYPKLTEVGAWRKEKDGNIYGGFYTQDDIREIVAYAQQRNITIVPEIDVPGHSSAAIAAYPWLGCTGKQIEVPNRWGIFKDIYKPSDSTFIFLRGVFDEVCALFPGPYVHIGGDEVPKKQWNESEFCRQLMKEKNLKNAEQLQHYFMKQIEDYLLAKGKRSIAWGEVMRGGVNDSMIVMSWRGKGAGIKAARRGNEVIMASRFYCYFDYPQSVKDKKAAWWMTYTPAKKVAKFNPQSKLLSEEQNKKIIGAEATLWTEYVTNEQQLWHQLLPRLKNFSEVMIIRK
jgi:hexosaminidase